MASSSACEEPTASTSSSPSGCSCSTTTGPWATPVSESSNAIAPGLIGGGSTKSSSPSPTLSWCWPSEEGQPVGYALCHIREGADDTWDTGDRIGEIETLVLSPDARGDGVGTALMDAAEAELGRRGAATTVTAVLEGNDRALDFYLRRGMKPTVTYLMKIRPERA